MNIKLRTRVETPPDVETKSYVTELTLGELSKLVDMFEEDPHSPPDKTISIIEGTKRTIEGMIKVRYAYYSSYPHEGIILLTNVT